LDLELPILNSTTSAVVAEGVAWSTSKPVQSCGFVGESGGDFNQP
jgi:hypothetical protein